MMRPSSPRVVSRRSVSGISSTAVRVGPNAGWRFPHSRWWMSHAGALLLSPMRQRRRDSFPCRLSWKIPGSTSTSSNCVRIGIACRRVSQYHCDDGYYAKKKYIDEVVSLNLHAITKLRSDADCVFLLHRPRFRSAMGHGASMTGRSTSKTCSRFEDLGTRGGWSRMCIRIPPSCGQDLQHACLLSSSSIGKTQAKPRFMVLGSTDPDLDRA